MNETNLFDKIIQPEELRDGAAVPHDDGHLLVGELSDIHASERVTFVQPPREKVGELIEFPEFPLGK